MKDISLGIIGCGTVGSGVIKWIINHASRIKSQHKINLIIKKVAVRNLTKKRLSVCKPEWLVDDPLTIINDQEISIVIELMGGERPALDYILGGLQAGKVVITANKALIAFHGEQLFRVAKENNTRLFFEASVGGGIPIINVLQEALVANNIQSIYGILNGTCNYILTRMERAGISFDKALQEAQTKGYAESDPTLDIAGDDTAHKICILASLAHRFWYVPEDIFVEGIQAIEPQDIMYAREAGYTIKLLGIAKCHGSENQQPPGKQGVAPTAGIQLRVHPTMIPTSSMIAGVHDVYNMVWMKGDMIGDSMLYGQGAGQDATASAVIADLMNAATDRCVNQSFSSNQAYYPVAIGDILCRYYIRLSIDDQPDALASITHLFGEASVSIASLLQKEIAAEKLPVVIITHTAKESDMQKIVQKIENLPVTHGKPVLLRIEDV